MRYRRPILAAVLTLVTICASLSTVPVLPQKSSRSSELPAGQNSDSANVEGKWTYRSFHNNPGLINGDPDRALSLLFAEAVFTFEAPSGTSLKGRIDWTGGGLDLQGKIEPGSIGTPITFNLVGLGRPGTATADWEYDYYGIIAHQWPNGINQVPALLGSVIRAKPHNGAPAGYVASFIAVKQP